MKKIALLLFGMMVVMTAQTQVPHLFEHTYPTVQEENPLIRQLMDQVSKDSLYAVIDHLQSYHTRRWDSQMVYEAQDWLFGQFEGMDFDKVFLHDFQFVYHDTLRETSDNVIAVQKGTLYPDEYVAFGAHYDSYNNNPGHPDSLRAPGADDNASGMASVLEVARLLSRCKFERSILYCGWAAEEAGLIGSDAFARDCAEQSIDIVGYFNLDMIGYLKEDSDIHVNLLYTTQDSTLANYVNSFSQVYFPEMPIWQSWLTWGDSDYSSFNRNGYASIQTFEDTHFSSPYIHTPNDILGVSVNSMDQVNRYTELNLGLVATLAGLISSGVDDVASPSLTVYPNPVGETLTIKGVPMRQVEVFNIMGQQVISHFLDGDVCEIKVGSLVPGIYFVRVFSTDGSFYNQKFVKQ